MSKLMNEVDLVILFVTISFAEQGSVNERFDAVVDHSYEILSSTFL